MPEPAKKNRLRAMKLEEISLVDHPANQDAHVVLFKRDDVEKGDQVECPECKAKLKDKFALNKHMMKEHPEKAPAKKARDPNDGDFIPLADQTSARRFLDAIGKMLGIQKDDYDDDTSDDTAGDSTDDATDFDDAYRQQQAYRIAGEVYDRADALVDALRDHFENGADPDALGGVVDQFGDSLKGSLSDLAKADSEALSKAGKKISADRLKRLKNAHEALANIISEAEGPEEQKPASKRQEEGDNVDKSKLDVEVREHVEDLEKRLADAERERDEFKKEESPEEQDVMKSLPEDVRKRFEAQEAEIAKMRDERETAEHVAKAQAFPHVPGTPDEIGGFRKRVAKGETTDEDVKYLDGLLGSAEEMISKGDLYRDIGKSGAGAASGSSALDELNVLAADIQKNNASLTIEKAFAKATEQRPDLKDRYTAELRGTR